MPRNLLQFRRQFSEDARQTENRYLNLIHCLTHIVSNGNLAIIHPVIVELFLIERENIPRPESISEILLMLLIDASNITALLSKF